MSVRELSPLTLSTGIPSTSHSMPTLAPMTLVAMAMAMADGRGRRVRWFMAWVVPWIVVVMVVGDIWLCSG